METLTSNNSQAASIPHKKLLLSENLNVKNQSLPLLRKLAPKYTRHATIFPKDFRKRDLSHLKSVWSFNFPGIMPSEALRLGSRRIVQIVKPYKKFTHYFKGIDMNLRLARELPQLCEYELNYLNPESSDQERILAYLSTLKTVFLNLRCRFLLQDKNLIVPVLQQNSRRALRAISRIRSIDKLRIRFNAKNSMCLLAFLEILGSCPISLSHLRYFSIGMTPIAPPAKIKEDLKLANQVEIALRYVTHLNLPNYQWFDALLEREILENLASLRAEIVEKEVPETAIRKLSDLRLFTKLQHLSLNFLSSSKAMQDVFLESFTLPADIEYVNLKLGDFAWGDDKLKLTENNREIIEDFFQDNSHFQNFYRQWEDLDNLKALVLIIDDRLQIMSCPALAFRFAEGILKRVKNLRKLQYEHTSTWKSLDDKTLPMALRGFWDCLDGSKDTLEDLDVQIFKKIKFFEEEDLEGLVKLKELKSLKIQGEIYGGMRFGDFLTRLSKQRGSILEVSFGNLCFTGINEVKDLLANILEIPRNVDIELRLDVSYLDWEDILCEYLEKVRGARRLNLQVRLQRITDMKILEVLKEKSRRSSTLKELVINQWASGRLYYIEKGNLIVK